MSLMSSLRRFIVSNSREKKMILWTIFWLFYFRLRNMILPYRLIKRSTSEEIVDEPSIETVNKPIIDEVSRTVERCQRFVPGATCLTQALATKAVLKRYGQNSTIRIGVAKSETSIDAHAWVEVNGQIILGRQPNNARYAMLRPPSVPSV